MQIQQKYWGISLVPFSKVVQLRICRDDPYTVDFMLSH